MSPGLKLTNLNGYKTPINRINISEEWSPKLKFNVEFTGEQPRTQNLR